MGIVWEVSLADFLLVTVFLGGGAAWLTGRAVALTWRSWWQLFLYAVLLGLAVRFIHFALFGGTLLSVRFYLVDLAILLALGSIGYRLTRTSQMVGQYSWLYSRSGPLSWRHREQAGGGTAGSG
jgi:hypothetical protein